MVSSNFVQNASITLIINNTKVSVPLNTTILQACEKLNILIPRFCYHENLSIAGNCRLCLVEIVGIQKLQVSCAMPVTANTKIVTNTASVQKARESIMEFLLANHPLDCPICDQGGECDLQDLAIAYGSDHGRYNEYKRAVVDKPIGLLIQTSMNRCIHCTRCVRFSSEVNNTSDLATIGRGNEIQITGSVFHTAELPTIRIFKKKFQSVSTSAELSGNLIDICPVGALTSASYAFNARPWELHSVESIDIFDATCNKIRFDTRGIGPGAILRVMPRTNNYTKLGIDTVYNFAGWITDKTRFSYDGLKYQRLTKPLIRSRFTFCLYEIKWAYLIKIFEKLHTFFFLDNTDTLKIFLNDTLEMESLISAKDFFNNICCSDNFQFLVQQSNSIVKKEKKIQNLWWEKSSENHEYMLKPYNLSQKHFRETLIDRFSSRDQILRFNENFYNANTIIFVGTNPQLEANLISVYLQSKTLDSKISVINIGAALHTNFVQQQVGHSIKTVLEIIEGRHPLCVQLINKSFVIAVGQSICHRLDGVELCNYLQKILYLWSQKKVGLNSVNNNLLLVLAATANQISGSFLGLSTLYNSTSHRITKRFSINKKINLKKIYSYEVSRELSLLTDEKKYFEILSFMIKNATKHLSTNCKKYIVYQGFYGNKTTQYADLVLPNLAPTEKSGTFINFEGGVVRTRTVTRQKTLSNEPNQIFNMISKRISKTNNFSVNINKRLSKFGITSKHLSNNSLFFNFKLKNHVWYKSNSVDYFKKNAINNPVFVYNSTSFFKPISIKKKSILVKSLACYIMYNIIKGNLKKAIFVQSFEIPTVSSPINQNPLFSFVDNFFITNVINNMSPTMINCSKNQTLKLSCFQQSI